MNQSVSDKALIDLAEQLDSFGAEKANNVVTLIAAVKECKASQVESTSLPLPAAALSLSYHATQPGCTQDCFERSKSIFSRGWAR